DFHELVSSPTADAGVTSSFAGPEGLDGNDRVLGAAPDIGAYELSVPVVSTGSAAISGLTATVTGTVNPEAIPVNVCTFQYGVTTGYGAASPARKILARQ